MPTPIVFEDFQTRFLWPFQMQRGRVVEAAAALQESGLSKDDAPLWICGEPVVLYRDEYFAPVVEFLFGDPREDCEYLTLDPAQIERWFADAELDMGHGVWQQLRPVPGVGCEIFLSSQGVGVLSLTLAPSKKELTWAKAQDFNHRLAQFRRRSAATIRKRHPAQDPEALARIPPQQRATLPPVPSPEAPLEQRLTTRGGTFDLQDLVERLLEPLSFLRYHPVQKELAVYTVVRLASGIDLGSPATRGELGPFLSGLAQVEESGHAGAPAGIVTTDNAILNRLHWSAVGMLGAAHVRGDQGEVAFDEQSVAILRDKYFTAYLLALLQRTVLHQAVDEAGRAALSHDPEAIGVLTSVRNHLIDFAVRGYFAQISARHAVQRFYELARVGLRVPEAWENVQRAIRDIDARNFASQQKVIADKSEAHLDAIQRVQGFVHVLEYGIVSVYFAHLFEMLHVANLLEKRNESAAVPQFGFSRDVAEAVAAGLGAAFGLFVAWLIDRWNRRRHGHGARESQR